MHHAYLSRRSFLLGGGAVLGLHPSMRALGQQSSPAPDNNVQRTYHILGVPLRSGSLYPGSEDDARAYRDAQILARLRAAGCTVLDDGDIALPSYLPHHSIPPIRSWPGPRIVWESLIERIVPLLKQPGHIPLLVGCDCSVVVGTAQALARSTTDEVHILYIDGDSDDAPPEAGRSQSAATLAVWLLTHDSPFWTGPALPPSNVTLLGNTSPPRPSSSGVRTVLLSDIRRMGAREAARRALAGIPPSAQILLHIDVDVFQKAELPAAYFPHAQGLTLAEGSQLIAALSADARVRLIEVSEYASLRDLDQRWVNKLIDILAHALSGSAR